MKKAFLIGFILIVAMAGIVVFGIARSKNVKSVPSVVDRTNVTPDTTSACKTDQAKTIVYCDSGFSDYLNVIAGETVTVTNNSSSVLDFESTTDASHQANAAMNLGTISPGQSKTFVANPLGRFIYQNKNQSSHTGEIGILDDL